MEQKQFPIPKSGQICIAPPAGDTFDVEFTALNIDDNNLLMGFYNSMQGRFGEFRFDHAGVLHSKCRFDSDSVSFVRDGPNEFSVTLPVKVLS